MMWALLLTLLTPEAQAFNSVGPWSVHESITQRAIKEADLGLYYRRRIKAGVNDGDFEQLTIDIPALLRLGLFRASRLEYSTVPTPRYQPGLHFDRRYDESTELAFARGLERVWFYRDAAQDAVERGDLELGLNLLGLSLHGVQDLVAHSNISQVDADAQQCVWTALSTRSTDIAGCGLVVAWYEPYDPIRTRHEARPRVRDRVARCEEGEQSHFCTSLDTKRTWYGSQKITLPSGKRVRRFRLAKDLATEWTAEWVRMAQQEMDLSRE